MACKFCDIDVYVKVLRTNVTGEEYVRAVTNFCPMCGERKFKNKVKTTSTTIPIHRDRGHCVDMVLTKEEETSDEDTKTN